MSKNSNNANYETNSYLHFTDVTTRTYFNILCDYDIKTLLHIVQEPMVHNQQLRVISRRFYSSAGIVRNTYNYMKSLPTLDYVISSYSKDKKTALNKEIMNYVLKKIKHKKIIRDAILKGCIDGVAFYYFNTTKPKKDNRKTLSDYEAYSITEVNALKPKLANINASVISLPVDYCRIIGMKNNSYVVAFNLEYFSKGNETAESKLKKYPPEFTVAYNNWTKGKIEANKMFILDNTKTIVHKISSNLDEIWGRPLILAAINDILYSDYFTNTKRNVLDNVNNKIVYETFPEGKTAGTSALTKEQQKQQHDAVKGAVQRKTSAGGTAFVSVAAGTKIGSIDVNTDIFDNDNESDLDIKIGTDLGFAVSLLSASGNTSFSAQQNNLELVSSQIFSWIDDIAEEINKVINYNILNLSYTDIEVNYLPITYLNRDKMFKIAKELYTIGRGSLTYLANCAGISKKVFYSMLDEQQEEGIMDKYPINATSYNTSGNNNTEEKTAGRPVEDNPVNDNTIISKTNGSNNLPSPSDS